MLVFRMLFCRTMRGMIYCRFRYMARVVFCGVMCMIRVLFMAVIVFHRAASSPLGYVHCYSIRLQKQQHFCFASGWCDQKNTPCSTCFLPEMRLVAGARCGQPLVSYWSRITPATAVSPATRALKASSRRAFTVVSPL